MPVVIVPGSFAPPNVYDVFVDSLTQHGVESEVVDLPSVGRRDVPQTMSDDVNEIVKVSSSLLDQGKEVVLMTHSYGGIPGTQSLKQLSRKAREAEGKTGGVDKIIYLASVVIQEGTSNFDLFGDSLPDELTMEDDYMRVDTAGIASMTFSDLPPDQALVWAKKLSVHSTPSFKEKLTYAGYRDVDVHYMVCEDDGIVPAQYQYAMIEMLKSATQRVDVHKLKSGHMPTASQPDTLASLVQSIISAP